jgi:hypothetical protein
MWSLTQFTHLKCAHDKVLLINPECLGLKTSTKSGLTRNALQAVSFKKFVISTAQSGFKELKKLSVKKEVRNAE